MEWKCCIFIPVVSIFSSVLLFVLLSVAVPVVVRDG